MNKNTIIGGALMVLIFAAMVWLNQPSPEQLEAQRHYKDSIARVDAQEKAEAMAQQIAAGSAAEGAIATGGDSLSQAAADSVRAVRLVQKYGNLAAAAEGESRVITLHNDVLSLQFNTKGGLLQRAELLQYKNYKDTTVVLFNPEDNQFYYTLLSIQGKYVSTADLYFRPIEVTGSSVVMRLEADPESYIDFCYTLPQGSYVVNYDLRYQGLDNIIAPNAPTLTLTWNQKLIRQEQGRTFEERYSSLFYKYATDDATDLSSSSADDERVNGNLSWVAFKNQFFSSALVSKNLFSAGDLSSSVFTEEQDPNYLKQYKAELEFDVNPSVAETIPMAFYLGPNSYPLLADIDDQIATQLDMEEGSLQMQKLVPLGWGIFGWVNRFLVIPVFNFLSNFISNYGIIILLLTIFIKLITFPFTYKSYLSSAKMRLVSKLPEVIAINEKYSAPEDNMAKQQALMAFYGKVGVSPAGGCVPMLLQWPVLLALFYFFPTSIELRGQGFLWAHDLSTYDSIYSWDATIPVISWIFGNHISLFCLLMTATNILYTKITMAQNAGQQTMPGMKLMTYGMPLIFFAVLNNYSSGLSLYYFLSTLLGIIQTYAIRASLNEDKILAQFQKNMKNPKKKKSGFLARLQEQQRKQMDELNKQRDKQQRRR